MKKLTAKQIAEMSKGQLIAGYPEETISEVVTDSRKAGRGKLFVALRGENHDAHTFLAGAFAQGCSAVMVSDRSVALDHLKAAIDGCGRELNPAIIVVEDTTQGLGELAKGYMETFDIKKVAVTGSTGKTSTKDMLHCVFSEKYVTAKTQGNFNNEIGMPLTALSLDEDVEAVVLEMGMSSFGEIEHLVDIARPDLAVITNVGISHMENLGSREGILKAKLEVTTFFDEDNLLIIYDDGDVLTRESAAGNYRLQTVGSEGHHEFVISDVEDRGAYGISFELSHEGATHKVMLPAPGAHNAINASLAIAAGLEIGIPIEDAIHGLARLELTNGRLSLKEAHGVKVIDDTYNASPDSMKAGLGVLAATRGSRHVAVLGDMYELGDDSYEHHRGVGRFAAEKELDLVVAIGEDAKGIAEGAAEGLPQEKVVYYRTKDEFIENIDQYIKKGDVVLVKGSRGMHMEIIVEKIIK